MASEMLIISSKSSKNGGSGMMIVSSTPITAMTSSMSRFFLNTFAAFVFVSCAINPFSLS